MPSGPANGKVAWSVCGGASSGLAILVALATELIGSQGARFQQAPRANDFSYILCCHLSRKAVRGQVFEGRWATSMASRKWAGGVRELSKAVKDFRNT